MVIHFDVETHDGDRTLYLEGTRTLVGWIEQGRTRGGKTEWRFVPADVDAGTGAVHTNGIAPAYADARAHAETLDPRRYSLDVSYADGRSHTFTNCSQVSTFMIMRNHSVYPVGIEGDLSGSWGEGRIVVSRTS